MEQLFDDIYKDFKWSPNFRKCLGGICELVDVKYTVPQRFLSHRWMSVLDLSEDTLRLFDCLSLLYFHFLSKSGQTIYHATVVDILASKNATLQTRDEIRRLRSTLGKVRMTPAGKQRKERIVKKLFFTKDDTLLQLKFFSSSLPLLKEFVLLFQRQDPLIHVLHDEQVSLVKQFLLCFIKAEVVKSFNTSTLLHRPVKSSAFG